VTEVAAACSVVVVVGGGEGAVLVRCGRRVPVLMTQNSVRAARTPLRRQTSFDVAAT